MRGCRCYHTNLQPLSRQLLLSQTVTVIYRRFFLPCALALPPIFLALSSSVAGPLAPAAAPISARSPRPPKRFLNLSSWPASAIRMLLLPCYVVVCVWECWECFV